MVLVTPEHDDRAGTLVKPPWPGFHEELTKVLDRHGLLSPFPQYPYAGLQHFAPIGRHVTAQQSFENVRSISKPSVFNHVLGAVYLRGKIVTALSNRSYRGFRFSSGGELDHVLFETTRRIAGRFCRRRASGDEYHDRKAGASHVQFQPSKHDSIKCLFPAQELPPLSATRESG